jgi:hypothetical protein
MHAHCTTPVALVLHHAKNEPTTVDADISVFSLLFAFVCAYSKMGIVGVDLTKFYRV